MDSRLLVCFFFAFVGGVHVDGLMSMLLCECKERKGGVLQWRGQVQVWYCFFLLLSLLWTSM